MAHVVHSRPLWREEWPFQMDADDARLHVDQRVDGGKRSFRLLGRIADQGRKQRRRAESAMRGGDGPNPIGRR